MILVVDDYADTGRAMCALLRAEGYPCEWVSSGPDALALVRAHPPEQPSLVVLDEMMPDMTGTDVLRAIRADPAIAGTKVIVYSAGFDVEKRDQAITLGAVAWLLKGGPDLAQPIRTITHWYEQVRRREDTDADPAETIHIAMSSAPGVGRATSVSVKRAPVRREQSQSRNQRERASERASEPGVPRATSSRRAQPSAVTPSRIA